MTIHHMHTDEFILGTGENLEGQESGQLYIAAEFDC